VLLVLLLAALAWVLHRRDVSRRGEVPGRLFLHHARYASADGSPTPRR